ncbi:MAG: phosphoenolpyruvate--protein phosphotransferase [Pirellulaceae bacterium]|nr:phosphoenolpyruvate--protein phosphotransferase [Pirellulaceae bacterium]
MRRGIAVAPGIAIGTAYCIHEVFVNPERRQILASEIETELASFESARQKSLVEVRAIQAKVLRQIGKSAAAIFAVHESILNDEALIQRIRTSIRDNLCTVQAALAKLLEHYQHLLNSHSNELFQNRLADIRDIVMRLSSHLSEALDEESGVLQGQLIVVADELLPSQAIMLGDRSIHGIVNQTGGQTSHAAIIARSRGIPAVSGVSNILKTVHTGDLLIVDGSQGHVIVNPGPETLAAYRKLEREFFDLQDRLADNRDRPSMTACRVPLQLLANINGLADTKAACAQGADGVGLYRTEYLYLASSDVPDEQEQLDNYRAVIAAAPNNRVTIRTLDIGGDKSIPFLNRGHSESNPFMGLRSIRLSFEHPALFLTQIRAIYQAASPRCSPGSQVNILFPMVATYEELRKLRSICRKAVESLKRDGLDFGQPKFGMMIEVPAAAMMIDQLLGAVDYVSIGSNDLIQYLMAADRDNPKVSSLCQPLSPAVLRVLESVIRTSQLAQRPVTLCGEMASQPAAFALLLGMGLRRFSMSPAYIPSIKELASQITIEQSQNLLKKALRERETRKIVRMINEQLFDLVPSLGPLLNRNA